jgi:hypothetical protein
MYGFSIINPYIETMSGSAFLFGYTTAGAKVVGAGVHNVMIQGGNAARSAITGVPIKAHSSTAFSIMNFRALEDIDQYVIGTDGNVYTCIANHTSGASTKPITGGSYAANWEQVTDGNATVVPAWIDSKAYTQNDILGNIPSSMVVSGSLSNPNLMYYNSNGFPLAVDRNVKQIARSSTAVDLSGAAETLVVFHAPFECHILKATLLYTEATSGDAGITVEIGKETDRDYFFTGTTETGKAQWYEKVVTLLKTDLNAGDTMTFYSPGGKTGTGEIILSIEYAIVGT